MGVNQLGGDLSLQACAELVAVVLLDSLVVLASGNIEMVGLESFLLEGAKAPVETPLTGSVLLLANWVPVSTAVSALETAVPLKPVIQVAVLQ